MIRQILVGSRALCLLAGWLAVCPQCALAAGTFTTPPGIDATAPVIVEAPSVVSLTNTTAIIRWVTGEMADARVQYGSGALSDLAVDPLLRQEHFVTLTRLTPQTAYSYRVMSTDPSGNTVTGSTLGFTTLATPDTTVPAFAAGPAVTQISANAAVVSWTTSEPVTWLLRYGPTGGSLPEQVAGEKVSIAQNSSLTNLVPGASYTVQVSAWDVAGNLGTSTALSFTTPPAVPSGVNATTSPGAFSLAWSAAQGATGYNVYRARQSGITRQNYASLPGGQKHAGVTSPFAASASAGETWYFFVTASNAGGESAESAEASVTIAAIVDTQAPTQPAGLTATPIGISQVNLGWTASTDNVGVTQYRIYRNTALLTTLTGAPPAASYSDMTVAAATTYSYTVQACDAAANCSAQSAVATATTPAGQIYSPHLESGFNLIGNSLNITLNVASIFGNQDAPVAGVTSNIVSVWKWKADPGRWAFYSPQLTVAGNAAHVASHNYEVLSTIVPGEGYWVNAIDPITLPAQSGTGYTWNALNFGALMSGFNLIATASSVTPSQFNASVSATPPAPGVVPTDNFVSLWAWDAVQGKWYFYSPLLESSGGLPAVKSYADSHNYLHFQDYNKTLGVGTGFWVNRP